MSYKDEIERQLKGMQLELCGAFSARLALRVLPLLAAEEKKRGFWF